MSNSPYLQWSTLPEEALKIVETYRERKGKDTLPLMVLADMLNEQGGELNDARAKLIRAKCDPKGFGLCPSDEEELKGQLSDALKEKILAALPFFPRHAMRNAFEVYFHHGLPGLKISTQGLEILEQNGVIDAVIPDMNSVHIIASTNQNAENFLVSMRQTPDQTVICSMTLPEQPVIDALTMEGVKAKLTHVSFEGLMHDYHELPAALCCARNGLPHLGALRLGNPYAMNSRGALIALMGSRLEYPEIHVSLPFSMSEQLRRNTNQEHGI